MEVLKKKDDLKDNVLTTILNRTQNEGKTVKKVLDILSEKYSETYAEKTQNMIKKMIKIQNIGEDKTAEEIWDNFAKLVGEFNKMELSKSPGYMLGMLLIECLEKNN